MSIDPQKSFNFWYYEIISILRWFCNFENYKFTQESIISYHNVGQINEKFGFFVLCYEERNDWFYWGNECGGTKITITTLKFTKWMNSTCNVILYKIQRCTYKLYMQKFLQWISSLLINSFVAVFIHLSRAL